MAALFACTKCHGRHPFEELSDGEQLCKECRNNYPIVKCTYCRAEFQQEDKTGTSSICKKCAYNVKLHGKPKACEYCNIIAAFIGVKCQRCAYSEKKYGNPQTCEQCKQQCAFERNEESRKRVDGKMLCWLCTMAYKRVLAKTKSKGGGGGGSNGLQMTSSSTSGNTTSSTSSLHRSSSSSSFRPGSKHSHNGSQSESDKMKDKDKDKSKDKSKDKDDKKSSSSSSSSQKQRSDTPDSTKNKERDSSDSGTPAKKQKLDKSTTNGLATSKSSDSMLNDFGSSDNMIAITQLKEEVESLKRATASKDKIILDREKTNTELKATNFEAEKKMRNQMTSLSKKHGEAMDALQVKIRELQRQVASLTKSNKS